MRNLAKTNLSRAIMLALVATLAACGGGSEQQTSANEGALNFVKQIPVSSTADVPMRALAATGVVNIETVLDWAEYKFASLFPKSPTSGSFPLDYEGVRYTVRAYVYAGGVRYLGITPNGDIYGLGDYTGYQLQSFGNISLYAAQVRADECSVYPGRCGGSNEPRGPLNGCTMTAQQMLVPGNRATATFVTTGYTTGQFTSVIAVQGSATFENQATILSNETITGTGTSEGVTTPLNINNKTYAVARADGFMTTVGTESVISSGGFSLTSKVVYKPADVNSEFGISQGQSFTKTLSLTSTSSPFGGTSSSTTSTTYAFEGVENIAVQGKTYNTCRYTETDATGVRKAWYIVGKGIPARVEETTNSPTGPQVTIQELVSGDINGQPL